MKSVLNVFITFLFFAQCKVAFATPMEIEKFQWGNLDVIWANDSRYPLFSMVVYFADGALSDGPNYGSTQAAFNLMTSGTKSFSQHDIAENLEYLAVSYGASVTHEYSTYSVSGPIKNLAPAMKMICHIFHDATFPEVEVAKEKKRSESAIKDMIDNHGPLAERAFREITLSGTPFSYPVGGKLKDISKLKSSALAAKIAYFNKQVKKRIYLTGPRSVLDIKKMLLEDCSWGQKEQNFIRALTPLENKQIAMAKDTAPKIILVKVPKANQAQIRLGKILGKNDVGQDEILEFSSSFIGGGFTSRLMREVRVKRGLTYSISARASGQREYGRSVISTFTKNETTEETIKVIKEVLNAVAKGEIDQEDFQRTKDFIVGSYPFRFEKTQAYLMQLLSLDHEGKSYDELYNLPTKISAIKSENLMASMSYLFPYDKLHIVVLGPIALKEKLEKIGKVEVRDYKDFL